MLRCNNTVNEFVSDVYILTNVFFGYGCLYIIFLQMLLFYMFLIGMKELKEFSLLCNINIFFYTL